MVTAESQTVRPRAARCHMCGTQSLRSSDPPPLPVPRVSRVLPRIGRARVRAPAARHRVSSSLRPRCSVGLDCSKFASAGNGMCRLCGANDTQSTGIDRLQQEVIRYAKHCRPTEHGTQPDTAGTNQNRPLLISGSGVRNPDGALQSSFSGAATPFLITIIEGAVAGLHSTRQ
jgi:hypothetical protein